MTYYHWLGAESEELEARAQGNDQPDSGWSPCRSLSQRMGVEDDGCITVIGLK